ncbi:protein kinase [uncultured Xanthomonas sp.]|uniref:protein kinase domain-containing protein n=1 Tax=uncultured Xanthomonas sp. TaxID=152831 RepID=UPI0025E561A3|nr:protein kinase [uncultured Xanthomonas sp.]
MDTAQAQLFRNELEGANIGGWLIKGYFGHGKSAVVMRGARNGEVAAIKVFHPELVERFGKDTQLERIRRETSLIGAHHQNVIRILDGGECPDTGRLYVAMEALPWKNLKERLSDVSVAHARSLVEQLASAAKFLEDRGLAHRDIKPENIAVSDDLTALKLLDLGVIRPFGVGGLTDLDARVFIGTLRYSSPEFLNREELDTEEGWRALTFYQIGAVLHDMLMHKEIFEEYSEPFALLVDAVKSVNPEVHSSDVDLVRVCRNCLVKDPLARLEIVKWEHFYPDTVSDTRDIAFRRIRERQAYYAQVRSQKQGADAEEQRILNQKLQLASAALDYKIGRLLTTLKCFPLHSIKPALNVELRSCSSQISFILDEAKGLTSPLRMDFNITMVDQNIDRPVFVLDASAVIGCQSISASRVNSGEIEDLLLDKPIEEWMLQILQMAYELIEQEAFTKD